MSLWKRLEPTAAWLWDNMELLCVIILLSVLLGLVLSHPPRCTYEFQREFILKVPPIAT